MRLRKNQPRSSLDLPELARTEGTADIVWERELVLLLATLEEHCPRLAQASPQADAILEHLVAMIERVIAFARPHAGHDARPFVEPLALAGQWQARAQVLLRELRPGWWQACRQLFFRQATPMDLRDRFRETIHEVPFLLSVFFLAFQERFVSNAVREGWAQVATEFLDDLRRVLNTLAV